ncbi:MAG: ATP-dependent DNA ligase, partial [Actinomycetota bacterium]
MTQNGRAEEIVVIEDREVRLSNPDKILFPERGETKLDLVRHYLRFAEQVMGTLGGRPLLMQRFPHGAMGSSFYQKRVPGSAPSWL